MTCQWHSSVSVIWGDKRKFVNLFSRELLKIRHQCKNTKITKCKLVCSHDARDSLWET